MSEGSKWKELMQLSPNVDEYGSGLAEFEDFCAYDNSGTITNTIIRHRTAQIVYPTSDLRF